MGGCADIATSLQGIEKWLDVHPALWSLLQNTGSVVSGAMWLAKLTPAGLVTGLVINYGYEQLLKLMDGNIEVAKEHLTTYFLGHDEDITQEQASYLANVAMKVLQTAGQIAVHQVAATKFNAVRKGSQLKTRQGGIGKKGEVKGSGSTKKQQRKQGEQPTEKQAQGTKTSAQGLSELRSGQIAEPDLMSAAEKWLGKEYKDMGNGRYISKDGLRQFRYGKHETKNLAKQHAHFERYDKPFGSGGKLIEKTVVDVTE